MHLKPQEIGGGVVRRMLKIGARQLKVGDTLTGNEVRAIPTANRMSLIDRGVIEVWPLIANAGDRFIVRTGKNDYDVIVGTKINETPLTKEAAEALAASPN